MYSDYTEIKEELKRIENKTISPTNSTICKKIALIRESNFDLYENSLLKYNKILEKLVMVNGDNIINIILEKVSSYGESSLTDSELELLDYYSNGDS